MVIFSCCYLFQQNYLIDDIPFWQDDPEAHEKFVRINRAYEVLKDEDLRKVYDLHGEKGLDGGRWGGSFLFYYLRSCMFVISSRVM